MAEQTQAERLAEVLADHSPVYNTSGRRIGCQCMDRVFYKTETWHDHLAAVVLAHLTTEGWAQGREEWGVRFPALGTVPRPSRELAVKEVARNPTSRQLVRRYEFDLTKWEPVDG